MENKKNETVSVALTPRQAIVLMDICERALGEEHSKYIELSRSEWMEAYRAFRDALFEAFKVKGEAQ